MTGSLAHAEGTATWTEIHPPFDLGQGIAWQFWLFLFFSSILVYFIGDMQREGGALLLGYLILFPGFFGLGWIIVWAIWRGTVASRRANRILRNAHAEFERQARAHGPVHYLDDSLDDQRYTGLALAGASLLVVQDGRMRQVRRDDLRGWRWQIHGPTKLYGGKGFDAMAHHATDTREREAINGFFLQTHDPAQPELHFRTSNERVCQKWEVILEHIASGRTDID